MSNALARPAPISVEDYLEGETRSEIKHEYVDGQVYAMAGAKLKHNLITANMRPTTSFGAVLLSLTQFNPGIDLSGIGMVGCSQYMGGESTLLFVPAGQPTFSTPFPVPNFPGVHVFAQSVVFDLVSGLTSLGALSSNGVDLGLGIQ